MLNLLPVLLTIVAVVVFIFLFTVYKLSSVRLLAGAITEIDPRDIPSESVGSLQQGEQFLWQEGFKRVCYLTRPAVIVGQPWGLQGVLYQHEETNTWAVIYVEPMMHPIFEWQLMFLTPTANDSWLGTMSGSEFGPGHFPANYIVQNIMVYAPQEQWASHRRLLVEHSSSIGKIEPEAGRLLDAFEMIFFQGLVETGGIVARGDEYQLSVPAAARTVLGLREMQRKLKPQKAAYQRENGSTHPPDESSVDIQTAAYETYKQVTDSSKSRWLSKTTILLISVLLFGAAFGLSLSLSTVFILVVVLFIHEAGHLLGMWMFGYRDLRMMFIPFMGALASGKKDRVTTWQEAIILLLGPAPGYILGVVILFSDYPDMPDWVAEYALISLVLNALNLLPFMPLDGGRLVSLALFNRLPLLQLAMTIVSIAALGYAGLAWGEVPALIVATLLLVSLPYLLKETRLLRHLLARQVHKSYTGNRQIIESISDHPVWQGNQPQNLWPLVDSLSYRVQHASAGLFASLLVLTLWLGTIVLPVAVSLPPEAASSFKLALGLISHEEQLQHLVDSQVEDFEEESDPLLKARIAVNISLMLGDDQDGTGRYYFDQARHIVSSGELNAAERGDLHAFMAAVCHPYEGDCEARYLLDAAREYEISGKRSNDAIDTYISLAELEQFNINQRLEYLDKAEVLLQGHPDPAWIPVLESRRGRLQERLGRPLAAEEHYWAAVSTAADSAPEALGLYQRELIDFFARQDRQQDALDALDQWLKRGVYNDSEWAGLPDRPQYLALWVLYDIDPREAKSRLTRLSSRNANEAVELGLADLLLTTRLDGPGAELSPASISKLEHKAEEIDDPWSLWHLLPVEASEFDEGDWEGEYGKLGNDWYAEMRLLWQRPELTRLASILAAD